MIKVKIIDEEKENLGKNWGEAEILGNSVQKIFEEQLTSVIKGIFNEMQVHLWILKGKAEVNICTRDLEIFLSVELKDLLAELGDIHVDGRVRHLAAIDAAIEQLQEIKKDAATKPGPEE